MNPKEQLADDSPMPFGKYGPKIRGGEGLKMSDVPASYFHWLWHKGLKNDKTSAVADYIRRNLTSLQAENDDLIWE